MRARRKVRTGVVVSDKMQLTVTVSLVRRFAHGFYGKQIVRTKTVAAHNDKGAKQGDTVRIVETRPLSKRKRWRVVAVVGRAEERGEGIRGSAGVDTEDRGQLGRAEGA